MPGIDSYRKQIEAALEYADNSHTFEDIKAGVEKGTLQFWPGFSAVIITEIVEVPRYKTLHLFLAGGNIAELQAMLPEIEKFAVHVSADRLTLAGRKGWLRSFLKDVGYAESLVVMEKKVG